MSRILRREFVAQCALAGAAGAQQKPASRKGRLKQGLTRGVFAPGTSFDEMCRVAAELGCYGLMRIGRFAENQVPRPPLRGGAKSSRLHGLMLGSVLPFDSRRLVRRGQVHADTQDGQNKLIAAK